MSHRTFLPPCLGIIAVLALLTGCKTTAPLQGPALSWQVPEQYEPRLKACFADKEKQARKLAVTYAAKYGSGVTGADVRVAPEVWPYFQAGVTGDWKGAAEFYRQLAYRSHHFGFTTNPDPQLVAIWQPVNETAWALRMLSAKQSESFVRYGQDLLAAVPAGGILLGTTDAGRFMPTFLCKSHMDGDPIFVISPNQLGDGSYRDYLDSMFATKLQLPQSADVDAAFQDYVSDARQRHASGQLKPAEEVVVVGKQTHVSGRGAVVAMNGHIARQLWERNRDVYVEGPFTPDWARPHFVPRGPVLYLSPKQQDGISEVDAAADRTWWAARVKEELGEAVDEHTPRERILALARTNYLSLADFGIRPELHAKLSETRRNFAMQAPSSRLALATQRAQAGKVYWWHCATSTNRATKLRMWIEAETAFRQALALCPNGQDVDTGYFDWLATTRRADEAAEVLALVEEMSPPADLDNDWLKRAKARLAPSPAGPDTMKPADR